MRKIIRQHVHVSIGIYLVTMSVQKARERTREKNRDRERGRERREIVEERAYEEEESMKGKANKGPRGLERKRDKRWMIRMV